jgi:hypothetical protein
MPGAGIDANPGSFITSETSGVKLRHRKAMAVKNLAAYFFNSGDPDTGYKERQILYLQKFQLA